MEHSPMLRLLDGHLTGPLLDDAKQIIDTTRDYAYRAVNVAMVQRNWLLGRRIAEETLHGEDRADYGTQVIKDLSKSLTELYGSGFTKTNLYQFVQFYKLFPSIFHTPCGKSTTFLSWSHYRLLLRVLDDTARDWYAREALSEGWSVRTLDRNISTQYYHRLLMSQNKDPVEKEMKRLTAAFEGDKLEFIKNPVVAEFLGIKQGAELTESKLETAIIDHIQQFMMELGKGFALVARQQHIQTEAKDYYIDLVFYNYILKCFMLIDLKTERITHQDVGQMDMYVRMYDELKRTEGDNPTIGLILCSETDEDIARYSVLRGNEQLFAAKYMVYLPTKEELQREIERQKEIFRLQQEEHTLPPNN